MADDVLVLLVHSNPNDAYSQHVHFTKYALLHQTHWEMVTKRLLHVSIGQFTHVRERYEHFT